MRVARYTIDQLNMRTKGKQIICFGSGNNFVHIFKSIKDTDICRRAKYIVDNDTRKWGSRISVNDLNLMIAEPRRLLEEDWSKTALLITIINYQGVVEQLQALFAGIENIECILYPTYRHRYDTWVDKITRRLKVKDLIIFQGEGDTCENAAALYSELSRSENSKKYKVGWLCDHPQWYKNTRREAYLLRGMPLKEHSFWEICSYYYFLNRARYLIYESKMIEKSRKEQISCYMNHGIPLKATKGKICVYSDTDYVLSPSENLNSIISEQFGAEEKQLVTCGAPRTDILYKKEHHKKLYQLINKEKYSRVILWAPTFRTMAGFTRKDSEADFVYGMPLIDSKESLNKLKDSLLKTNILMIVKPHIHQEMSELLIADEGNLRVIKQDVLDGVGATVYDLMKLSDALISDYSSIAFDYLLLNRMVAYTIDDIQQYSIGFSVDNPLDYMPGVHMNSIDELIQFICDVGNGIDAYKEKRRELKERLFQYDDGKNAERLLKLLGLKEVRV